MSKNRTAPRLYRSRRERMLGGVCAGIAEYFGWSPTTVRIVFVASILLPGPQVLAYLLLWVIVPLAPTAQEQVIDLG